MILLKHLHPQGIHKRGEEVLVRMVQNNIHLQKGGEIKKAGRDQGRQAGGRGVTGEVQECPNGNRVGKKEREKRESVST